MTKPIASGLRWSMAVAVLFGVMSLTKAQDPAKAPRIEEIEKAGEALQKGKLDEAYKILEEVAKKKPELPPARLMLGRMLMRFRDAQPQQSQARASVDQACRATLEQAANENPEHPDVYLTFAAIAMNEGRMTEVVLNCVKALEYAAAKKWTDEQRKNFEREARSGLASASEARKDWEKARKYLSEWLAADPKSPQLSQLRQRLAAATFFLDKPDDALLELQAAVRDDPNLEPPTVTLGRLWTAKGDYAKAREWLEKAIKAEPNSAKVHLAYADWLLQQNEVDAAKSHVDEAAKIKAEEPEVQRLRGLIARVQKDYPTAEKIFRRIITDSPGDFFASNQLALVLADSPDKEQRSRAVQFAEVNARQYPRSADAASTLGYVYYKTGNLDDAQKLLQAALSNGQTTSDTAYYYARILNDREKYEEARKLIEGALEAKGLFVYRKQAQELLETLKTKAPAKTPEKKP